MSISMDQLHRYSLDQYHQLIESGGLAEDTRVELIEGLLVDMSPRGREHDNATAWLTNWLFDHVDRSRFEIRVASALTLARSEPEPDLFVFARHTARPFHPGGAALVVEVAVSSLRHDLLIKSRVYAEAGISEYWVVDVEGERVVRHLERAGDAYRRVDEVRDSLIASALELPSLDLRELFAAAFS